MLLKKTIQFLLSVLFIAALTSTANASTINTSIDLTVSFLDDDPYYDLEDGDLVTIDITYDDAQGDNAGFFSMHMPQNDTEFSIEMDFGKDAGGTVVTYTTADDEYGWPLVSFDYDATTGIIGDIDTIDFYVVDDDLNYWVRIETESGNIALTAGPVPEPATFTLFGLSLLGLVGLHRKRSLR